MKALALLGCLLATSIHPGDASAASDGFRGRFFSRGLDNVERPLVLRKFSVRVTTGGGVLWSHLTMEVRSPFIEQVEAVMRLGVPPGAAVTGTVLWVNGQPVKVALLEAPRAEAIYEAIVRGRHDPALVTWDAAGWISVSIFPLEHQQPRRLELDWVEPAATVRGRVQYRLPVVTIGSRVVGRASLEVDGRPVSPHVDDGPTITIASSEGEAVVAGRVPGDPLLYLLARVPVLSRPPRFVVLAETSAAMTADHRARQRSSIKALLAGLPSGAKVTLLAADWRTELVAEDVDASRSTAALTALDAIVSAGALDIRRALRQAATHANVQGADAVFFVGTGENAIERDASQVATEIQDYVEGRLALHVVDLGDGYPRDTLGRIAFLTGGEVLSSELGTSLQTVAGGIYRRSRRPKIDLSSSGPWYPLQTVTGEPVWIAQASRAPAGVLVRDALGDGLRSLWARARLGWNGLSRTSGEAATSVFGPQMAWLALEPGPGDEQGSLRLPVSDPSRATARPRGERPSSGVLAPNAALTARRAHTPDVIALDCVVRGSLDASSIRRTIRRRINEVRFCYEEELIKTHDLRGRVTMQLTISTSGRVASAVVKRSTMANDKVERCIAQAAKAWTFPATNNGGDTLVTYPFVLVKAGGEPPQDDDLEALETLTGDAPVERRVAPIARSFGLPAETDAITLAWRIEARGASLARVRLVARLLDLGGRRADAIRVLSERAWSDPVAISQELRRMRADADAEEILSLIQDPLQDVPLESAAPVGE